MEKEGTAEKKGKVEKRGTQIEFFLPLTYLGFLISAWENTPMGLCYVQTNRNAQRSEYITHGIMEYNVYKISG